MGEIKHRTYNRKGAFVYEADDKSLAEMVYNMVNDHLMIIEHTEVDDSLRGQGVGKKLQAALVDFVRLHQIKVIPICPFAKTTFERMKEWQDVLANRSQA